MTYNRDSRSAIVAAATTLLFTTCLIATFPAPAGAATSNCGSGRACLWSKQNFVRDGGTNQNPDLTFLGGIPMFSNFGFDNKASSLSNNGNVQNACFYKNSYSGTMVKYGPGKGDADLTTTVAGNLNDALSSGQFC